MAQQFKRRKFDKKSLENINQWLYKNLQNHEKKFLKRIDLEYDIWCMNLSNNYKYILDLIADYRKIISIEHGETKRMKGDELIKEELNRFLSEIYAFIVYLALDSNNKSESFLPQNYLYGDYNKLEVVKKIKNTIIKHGVPTKNLAVKIEALTTLIDIFRDLTIKYKNNDLNTLLTKDEDYILNTLFHAYNHRLSNLADKLTKYQKTNYIILLEDCSSKITAQNEVFSFIANLKSHINITLSLYNKLENLHDRLAKEPISYDNLFQIAERLFKNAESSFQFYEYYEKNREEDFKNLFTENYITVLATENYLSKVLSGLVDPNNHIIHPYIKFYLVDENSFEYELSVDARQKLIEDLKAFLYTVKILQYCNILAYTLDFNRNNLKSEDFEVVLREYCCYSTHLVRFFVMNLIELLLNVRITMDHSLDFMQQLDTNVQFEILNYLNNICSVSGNQNIDDYVDAAKMVFNFTRCLMKSEENSQLANRVLKTSECDDVMRLLANLAKRVVKLISNINESIFKSVSIIRLGVAKMVKKNLNKIKHLKSKLEIDTIKIYLDILIDLLGKLNQLKNTERRLLRPLRPFPARNQGFTIGNICKFLFKCASLLSSACVKVICLIDEVNKRKALVG
jgi:hypothetical protein